jgi:regulator of protease activity HflC (stomatin/prohibitin superfamily)
MQSEKRKKNTLGLGIVILIVVVIVIFLILTIRTVNTGEVAVVTRFGVITGSQGAGLHFKSPLEEYHIISVTQNQVEDIYYTATKDTQSVNQQIVTQVSVDPARVEELYRKFTGNHLDGIIKPVLYDGFKSATAGYTLEGAIAQRDSLAAQMLANVKDRLEPYGINVISVEIKDVQIPEAYAKAVEEKKTAEQIKLRTEIEKETAIIKADQELEISRLEAEAAKLQADINDTVAQTLTDEILRKMYIEKWDGKLPVYMSGDGAGLNMLLPAEGSAQMSAAAPGTASGQE